MCSTCLLALQIELADVAGIIPTAQGDKPGSLPSLEDDLHVTNSREDRIPAPTAPITRGTNRVLPYRPHASEALWVLRTVLATWTGELGGPATGDTRELAGWVLNNLNQVGKCRDAGDLIDEVTDAIHQARRAIDRPNDRRIFLGKCENRWHPTPEVHTGPEVTCLEEVYGMPWEHLAVCPVCGAEHNIEERQEQLRARADGYQGTAPEVAGFLRATGLRVTSEMIRGYAHRGRLVPSGTNARGHPLYRMNDVVEAVAARRTPLPKKKIEKV